MARRSADSLSITTISIPLRAKPPRELSKRQKKLWKEILNTKPPDWFEADSLPILRAYVVAIDMHEQLTAEIAGLDDLLVDIRDPIERIPLLQGKLKILEAQTKQAALMAALAVKMRLTQQSRYTPQAAATANKKTAAGKKPWEA